MARSVDTTVLVLVPESGDGIQTLKSGIMEIGDVFVVNKADRPGADRLRNEIEVTLGIRAGNAFRHVKSHHGAKLDAAARKQMQEHGDPNAWAHSVLATIASQGEGIDALVESLDRHQEWLERTGSLTERRRARLLDRTREVVNRSTRAWLWSETGATQQIEDRLDDLASGQVSPYEVAAEVLDGLKQGARA